MASNIGIGIKLNPIFNKRELALNFLNNSMKWIDG